MRTRPALSRTRTHPEALPGQVSCIVEADEGLVCCPGYTCQTRHGATDLPWKAGSVRGAGNSVRLNAQCSMKADEAAERGRCLAIQAIDQALKSVAGMGLPM